MSKLTFEQIKKECKQGDILIKENGCEREFIGFTSNNLLVTCADGGCGAFCWEESEISNWKTKPKTQKVTLYRYLVRNRITDEISWSKWSSDRFTLSSYELLKTETKEQEY